MSDAHTKSVDELLLSAAILIERAITHLNVEETQCDSCGGRHFKNRTHAKAYERISNTPDRLRSVAALLKTGIEPDGSQVVDTVAESLGLTRKRKR
jgi:hypothetical protein